MHTIMFLDDWDTDRARPMHAIAALVSESEVSFASYYDPP